MEGAVDMPIHSILSLVTACALLAGAQMKVIITPKPVESLPALRLHIGSVGLPPTSLCRADEQVIFSCQVAGGLKFASVCGSKRLDAERGYVQYRFGRSGAPELVFPQGLKDTQKAFHYAHYFRAQVDRTELSFEHGGYKYSLYDYYEGDVKPVIREAGVRVTQAGGGRDSVELRCRGRAVNRLGVLSSVVPNDTDSELGPGG